MVYNLWFPTQEACMVHKPFCARRRGRLRPSIFWWPLPLFACPCKLRGMGGWAFCKPKRWRYVPTCLRRKKPYAQYPKRTSFQLKRHAWCTNLFARDGVEGSGHLSFDGLCPFLLALASFLPPFLSPGANRASDLSWREVDWGHFLCHVLCCPTWVPKVGLEGIRGPTPPPLD